MTSLRTTTPPPRRIKRDVFLKMIRTASAAGHLRFTREACLAWLATFPGDLPVNLIYGQTLLKEGCADQALPTLEKLCQADPEYLEAYAAKLEAEIRLQAARTSQPKAPLQTYRHATGPHPEQTRTYLYALGGDAKTLIVGAKNLDSGGVEYQTSWSVQVRQARLALVQDKAPGQVEIVSLDEAEALLHGALASPETNPLVAITHLRLMQAKKAPAQSLRKLAEYYLQRWPACLQLSLVLANVLMEGGEPDKAVSLLHKAAARDVTGQVVSRLWGDHHPYLTLWPEHLEIELEIAIPAAVTAALGWNQLPEVANIFTPGAFSSRQFSNAFAKSTNRAQAGKRAAGPGIASYAVPESLRPIQDELERVAERLHQSGLANTDGRFPVYVVMTTRAGLEAHYGAKATTLIEQEMKRLTAIVQQRRDWHALLFFADQPSFPDVKPARFNDPWSLKLALADLDAALGQKGEMIGAVLIVGGPEVVPFHNLPNPVDDADDDVPSDNPYSTRDENYFIPEWPVGRLPGGCSPDPSSLISGLSNLTRRHTELVRQSRKTSWVKSWWNRVTAWLRINPATNKGNGHKRTSFGYTAAVWQRASAIVFRPIGEPKTLKVSPPLRINTPASYPLPQAKLGYFNLHGLVDAVEWFGQSDPEGSSPKASSKQAVENQVADEGLDYPVAVRPQDVQSGGSSPDIVFTEACYGNHILGRQVDEALSLKFLQAGCQAVAGSTCTSYGSITAPLIAADFLGHSFWNYLRQGCPAGEALRRAKISLAREMHQRQGYLDGEDQKTLISFVLYGDPLALAGGLKVQSKSILRSLKPPIRLKMICDRQHEEEANQPIPADVIAHAKQIVRQYLPGMEGAQMLYSHEHNNCGKPGQPCQSNLGGSDANKGKTRGAAAETAPKRRVVVLSKQVASSDHMHQHFARITLDEQNRLVKLVVSR